MTLRRLHLLALIFLPVAVAPAARPPDWLVLPAASEARPTGTSDWILADFQRYIQDSPETVRTRQRFAIMPLSEAGVRNCSFARSFVAGWSSVVSARAWAVSPDGKECREYGITDFVIASPVVNQLTWDQGKTISFWRPKAIQPGWIMAWEVEIKSDSNAFDFAWAPRRRWPVRTASLELVPEAGGKVDWRGFSPDLPAAAAFGNAGGWRWVATDLAGTGEDVPVKMQRDLVWLRSYLLQNPAEQKTWAGVVRLARAEMEPKAIVTPAVMAQAKALRGSGDFWSTVRPVCQFVQREISYLEVAIASDSMAGYRPHPASEVCDNRFGDCKDKAVLLCTMLRGLGAEAYVTLVNNGWPAANRLDWPSANFNHAIVAIACPTAPPQGAPVVRVAGRDYLLFDPTDEYVPFGLLPSSDTGGLGLVMAPDSEAPVVIPQRAVAEPAVVRNVVMALAPDGSAAFDLQVRMTGLPAAAAIAGEETQPLQRRTGDLEQAIARRIPLISDLTWTSRPEAEGMGWNMNAHFTAQYVGRRMSGSMYVPADAFTVVPVADPWVSPDAGWVEVDPTDALRTLRVTIPTGWAVSELPPAWKLSTPAGVAEVAYVQLEGAIEGTTRLRVTGGVLDRSSYGGYRDLLHQAQVAEHRPIVLGRIKAAAVPPPAAH